MLPPTTRPAVPAGVLALGLASLCMDASSELIHSLLPVFMSTVLGASLLAVGLVEGVAEATAAICRLFSGALSDRWQRRKGLVLLGYGLAALTKPVFPLAGSLGAVLAARFVDRVGKGIRGAPRDALIADITPPALHNAAYGLRQSLDSVGACLGPLLAVAFMFVWQNDIRAVLWVAVIPAALTVLVLIVGVREPESSSRHPPGRRTRLFDRAGLRQLGGRFWLIVAFAGVLTLARFSEAFLVLRAADVGIPLALVPAVMVLMNLVYALSAYPAGLAAERWSRRSLLAAGVAMLILADGALAYAPTAGFVFLGTALWGLHLGLTQGLLSALVAGVASPAQRGTAFGVFNFVTGILLLVASLQAGALWDAFGPAATFLAGGALATVALAGLWAAGRGTPAVRPEIEA